MRQAFCFSKNNGEYLNSAKIRQRNARILYVMTRVITITSGKGGVGKTTVTANLGRALAALNKKVVVVEGDIGLNNLDVCLGAEEKIVFDAGEVALGKATVAQAVVPLGENLSFFPATTSASNLITTDVFLGIVRELKNSFDYVLIDSPAGLEENFHRSSVGATEGILVVTPHISSVRDGSKTVKALASYGIHNVGLVVNRVRGEFVEDKTSLSPEEIAKSLHLPILGVLPEDDYLNLYGLADVESRRSDTTYSYSLIAENLEKGSHKIFDYRAKYKGFGNKMKRWLGL